MSNPLDAIKGAIESGNVQEAIDKAQGTYTEKVKPADAANYPQADMPTAADPTPFSIGPLPR